MEDIDELESLIRAARGQPNMVSNCCDARPEGELDGTIGMCSNCKDFAEFQEYAEDE